MNMRHYIISIILALNFCFTSTAMKIDTPFSLSWENKIKDKFIVVSKDEKTLSIKDNNLFYCILSKQIFSSPQDNQEGKDNSILYAEIFYIEVYLSRSESLLLGVADREKEIPLITQLREDDLVYVVGEDTITYENNKESLIYKDEIIFEEGTFIGLLLDMNARTLSYITQIKDINKKPYQYDINKEIKVFKNLPSSVRIIACTDGSTLTFSNIINTEKKINSYLRNDEDYRVNAQKIFLDNFILEHNLINKTPN